MTAHQNALIKTIIVVVTVAIIFAIANVWPPILGYAAAIFFVGMFIAIIYGAFRMYEDSKNINKRF